MLRILQFGVHCIRATFTALTVACLAVMIVVVGLQVLGRYFDLFNISGLSEIGIFAQFWLALLGGGLALRRSTLFAIDVLPSMLSLRPARAVGIAVSIASVFFIGVMIYGGLRLVSIGFVQFSPTLSIPMWVVLLVLPIGMAYLALEVLLRVIDTWNDPFPRASEGELE